MRYTSDYVWSWNYPRLHLGVLLNNNLLVETASSIFLVPVICCLAAPHLPEKIDIKLVYFSGSLEKRLR